jgi:hypothetical protein
MNGNCPDGTDYIIRDRNPRNTQPNVSQNGIGNEEFYTRVLIVFTPGDTLVPDVKGEEDPLIRTGLTTAPTRGLRHRVPMSDDSVLIGGALEQGNPPLSKFQSALRRQAAEITYLPNAARYGVRQCQHRGVK